MNRGLTVHNSSLAEQHPLRLPPAIERAGEHARAKFIEFFVNQIANDNTRAAYGRAAKDFFYWCESKQLELDDVKPVHAGAYVRTHPGSDATVKQHLAALRTLYDWMSSQGAATLNPFATVRGPKLSRQTGSTPDLAPKEVQRLFEAIDLTKLSDLRDRALLAAMLYTFGRVSAVLGMRVRDYAPAGSGKRVLHLREKGGKRHQVPAHHQLREYLDAYITTAELWDNPDTPLFQSVTRSGELSGNRLKRQRAWEMVQRRCKAAGIAKMISPHSCRATGITNFLENGGELEAAQRIAAHSDPRTTKLYDRRGLKIAQGEVERIRFE